MALLACQARKREERQWHSKPSGAGTAWLSIRHVPALLLLLPLPALAALFLHVHHLYLLLPSPASAVLTSVVAVDVAGAWCGCAAAASSVRSAQVGALNSHGSALSS